jgi:hypothetical protein
MNDFMDIGIEMRDGSAMLASLTVADEAGLNPLLKRICRRVAWWLCTTTRRVL